VITGIADKTRELQQFTPYIEQIREKTMQSRSQSLCAQQFSTENREKIVSEYIKMFIYLSDAWLEARNCFGLGDKCNFNCQNTKDLPKNFLEWMNSSRLLMNNIIASLESHTPTQQINQYKESFSNFLPMVPEARDQRQSNYPPIALEPKEYVHIQKPWKEPFLAPNIQRQVQQWYPTPVPPQVFTMTQTETDDYLQPASYEVPRKELSKLKKNINVTKAKAQAWEDEPLTTACVMQLPKSAPKKSSGSSSSNSFKDGKSGRSEDSDFEQDEEFLKSFGQVQKFSEKPSKRCMTKAQSIVASHIAKFLIQSAAQKMLTPNFYRVSNRFENYNNFG